MKNTKRLDKILSNLGFGSRKGIKKLAKTKVIKINGETQYDSGVHVDVDNDLIEVNGEKVVYKEFVYLMLNKPQGYISATYDNNHKTVIDLVPNEFKNFELFPVGRLDIDTEGLLILTNDGKLSHELLTPKKHVSKNYYAIIDGEVTNDDIKSFKKGVIIGDDYKTLPAKLKIIESGEVSKVEVTIFEGKYHQVKRMFESVGKKVTYLKRVQMGGLILDTNLKISDIRELTSLELEKLTNTQN